jgi:phosphoribosylformimino-5-aminoimidazole carboxamide ribonucleotide (ProFAR) isomerase
MYGMFPDTPETIEMKDRHKEKTPVPGGLEIIPALSVRKGVPVHALEDGFEEFATDIETAVEKLLSKHQKLLLIDYDGLLSNRPQLDLLQDIQNYASDNDIDLELWVEAGVRFADSTIDLFVAGADSVVICTSLVASLKEFKKACEMSQSLILSIDCDSGGKVVSPSRLIREKKPATLVEECAKSGVGKFILDTVVTDESPVKGSDAANGATSVLGKLLSGARSAASTPGAQGAEGASGTITSPIYIHMDSGRLEKDAKSLEKTGIAGILLDISEKDLKGYPDK